MPLELCLVDVRVYFDYIELNEKVYVEYNTVDVNTIHFRAPSCPLSRDNQKRAVPIRITQNGTIIGKVDFIYNSRKHIQCSLC